MFKARRPPDAVAAVVVLLEALHPVEPPLEPPVEPVVEPRVDQPLGRVHPEPLLVDPEQAHPEVRCLEAFLAEGPAVPVAVEAEPLHFLPNNLKPWPVNSMPLLV